MAQHSVDRHHACATLPTYVGDLLPLLLLLLLCCCCRASQDSWAAHHARLLIRLEQQLEDIDAADADAKAASEAAQATTAALHAQERRQLQQQQQQMELLVEQLEQQVQQLERDGAVKQQQQEELTSMCAQVSAGWRLPQVIRVINPVGSLVRPVPRRRRSPTGGVVQPMLQVNNYTKWY